MADMVTKQELEAAKIDVKHAGEAVNTKKVITPRYGAPFKSLPLVVAEAQAKADEVVAQGFYRGYTTEALLLAAKPAVAEMRARADDTRKIYRWNRTSAEGVTPVTGNWVDTGLSELDLAKADATTKANAAQANAITAAAIDATTKANAAEANAKAYTDINKDVLYSNILDNSDTRAFDSDFFSINGVYRGGGFEPSATYRVTPKIPVTRGDVIELSTVITVHAFPMLVAFDDLDQVVEILYAPIISSEAQSLRYVVESDGFIASQKLKSTSEDCYVTINEGRKRFNELDLTLSNTLRLESIEGYKPSKNLFDPTFANTSYYFSTSSERLTSNKGLEHLAVTGFIEVSPNTVYTINSTFRGSLYGEYDANKTLVASYSSSSEGETSFTTGESTKFVRINFNKEAVGSDGFVVVEGDSIPDDSMLLRGFTWLDSAIRNALAEGIDISLIGANARFAGKRLMVTGDSITQNNPSITSKPWHSYLKDWLNLSEVQNDARNGTGLIKSSGGANGANYRLSSWGDKYDEPDIIAIMGNMNDGTSDATGDWSWVYGIDDAHKDDFTTIVDESNMSESLWFALRYLFEELIRQHPTKPILYIISQPRSQVAVKTGIPRDGYSAKCWGNDGWFSEWVEVINKVAGHYSI